MQREMVIGLICAQLYSLTDRQLSLLLQELLVSNAKVTQKYRTQEAFKK